MNTEVDHFLTLKRTVHSKVDNTIKYVFSRRDDSVMELSYINKNDGKDIICVPCQTMCNLGCKFCQATDYIGKIQTKPIMGVEISEAIRYIYNDLNLIANPKTLLVSFMGMGEPTLNSKNVIDAMMLIKCEYENIYTRFAFATSLPDFLVVEFFEMARLIKFHNLPVKLHISLHYTNDELRKEWMPKALDIKSTLAAANFYKVFTGNPVEIHYALISGVNDSYSDAAELAHLLKKTGFNVKFLLYNEKKSLEAHASDIEKFKSFRSILDMSESIDSEYYIPPGSDIGSSCGAFLMDEYIV